MHAIKALSDARVKGEEEEAGDAQRLPTWNLEDWPARDPSA